MSLRHGALRWLHVLGLGGALLPSLLLTVGHAQVKSALTPGWHAEDGGQPARPRL